ncbi:unnamed protein product [Mycena citricolor]|uniref:NFACT RNA-binding domain-containing protein n=1 Tax=Mycena citricolor TaxID=2018698 RepID=A0AAD2HZ65_9AGAR|nr:unnamed protein product [Mycena citricolor]
MVLFFTSTAVSPSVVIYMGKDKVENEDLIKYAYPNDIWFHVDKLSSAHVYIRLPEDGSITWEAIPQNLLIDCAQLVKANSIEGKSAVGAETISDHCDPGNKKDNLTIIYTPADNLKAGAFSLRSSALTTILRFRKRVTWPWDRCRSTTIRDASDDPRVHVAKRENPIVNRLTKTKVERVVDHEQDRIDRLKRENSERRLAANDKKKADLELARAREAEKAARSYDSLFNADDEYEYQSTRGKSVKEIEEDFM